MHDSKHYERPTYFQWAPSFANARTMVDQAIKLEDSRQAEKENMQEMQA